MGRKLQRPRRCLVAVVQWHHVTDEHRCNVVELELACGHRWRWSVMPGPNELPGNVASCPHCVLEEVEAEEAKQGTARALRAADMERLRMRMGEPETGPGNGWDEDADADLYAFLRSGDQ